MKLLNNSMWRMLRFEQGALYRSDEAGVKRGDAANEDGLDIGAVTAGVGGNNVEAGKVVAEASLTSGVEV